MDGGVIRNRSLYILNIVALVLVGAFNLIDCISERSPFLDYILYVLVFYLIAGFIIYAAKKNKYKWNALLFAILGIGTLLGNEPDNYSGAVFIMFSLYIFNSKKTNLILMAVMIITIVGKNIFFDLDITNTVNLFLVYAYVFLVYYILIHPKKPIIISGPNLDYENTKIVEYLVAGYTNKEIAYRVALTENAVTKRLLAIRSNFGARTNSQLSFILSKKGYFRHD